MTIDEIIEVIRDERNISALKVEIITKLRSQEARIAELEAVLEQVLALREKKLFKEWSDNVQPELKNALERVTNERT